MLYIKNEVTAVKILEFENVQVESIWVSLGSSKDRLIIGVCYRCPSADDLEMKNLLNIIKHLSSKVKW